MNEVLSFPDADFPVIPEFQTEYQQRVAIGRKRMSKIRAVICGLARDVAHILPQTIARIEAMGAMFADYRVVIYENDSQDGTKAVLSEWASRNEKADIKIEECGDPVNPNARCLKRAERMAKYRNACLEAVRARYSDFDHVIVVDTDLQFGWSNEGVANTFGHDGWDFVGSNGLILRRCGISLNTHLQYDAWAFRQDDQFTPLTTAEVNYMSWQRGAPLVPVTCSFGGLGVYRMPAYLAGAYAGHDIEHVTHQQTAQARGYKNVFLNPSQITLYGRHRRRSDLWMIPLITAAIRVLEAAGIVSAPCSSRSFRAAKRHIESSSGQMEFEDADNLTEDGNIIPSPTHQTRSKNRSKAILLTSYNTGAEKGKNLGVAGYSHDIVAELYRPLLERWGEVVSIGNPSLELEAAAQAARERNLDPVHFSILPLQDLVLCQSAPNVAVPAWEFPDVPDHEFDRNSQNDWPSTANRCASVFVGGPFTMKALRKAGTTVPIHIVPVPTPNQYFQLPLWNSEQNSTVNCAAVVLPQAGLTPPETVIPPAAFGNKNPPKRKRSRFKQLAVNVEEGIRYACKKVFGQLLHGHYQRLERCFHAAKAAYRDDDKPMTISIPYNCSTQFDLSGVVYTSIFNPSDGRKNWRDLLTGFLYALGDREDATLVIKLISSNADAVEEVFDHYCHRDIPHRCKVVIITDYLSEKQLQQLAQASTYYLQTTKAEGNCLPLMNYLAAGRPGISPSHSAIADYFDAGVGFIVDSHPEPAAWPHDSRLRLRSSWARIVWPSLVEQLRASYDQAKSAPAAYHEQAARARERMWGWASEEQVWKQLSAALDATSGSAVDVRSYESVRRIA